MFKKNFSSIILSSFLILFSVGCAPKSAEINQAQLSPLYSASTLVSAVKTGDLNLVAKHLKAKISADTKDSDGNPVLHLSVTAKDEKMMTLLLDKGADINSVNAQGLTPLHLAVTTNTQSLIELLLNKGAATNIANIQGNTAIHTATTDNNEVVITMILKQHPTDLKLKNKEGLTPLLLAIASGHFQLIKYYLENKADLNAQTNGGLTALQIAMRSDSLQTLDFLLKKGSKLEEVTATGKTLLHLAAESGSIKLVNFLYKKGLKLDAKDKNKLYALDYAVQNSHSKVVTYLLSKQKKFTEEHKFNLLKAAVQSKDLKTLLALYKGGIDLSTIEKKTGSSLLHFAVSLEGMEDTITFILGKTDLITHEDTQKLTALDYANKDKKESYIQIMKPFYLKVVIKKHIAKDDFLGLKALKKKYPKVLELITDKTYKLALSGPETLMIGDLKILSKKGRSTSILISQIKRQPSGYPNFSTDDIGILGSYGLSDKLIAALVDKTDALAKESSRAKQAQALRKIQESILKVQELSLQAQSKIAKFQEINAELLKQLLEKQDRIIQEHIATREALKSSQSSGSTNSLASQITQKIVDEALK